MTELASFIKKSGLNATLTSPIPQPKGVGVRMPDQQHANAKFSSDDWLDKHNPYLATLRNPLAVAGARIPDDATQVATTTMQVIYHGQVTSGSTAALSTCGVIIGPETAIGSGPFLVPQNSINCPINAGSVAGAIGMVTNNSAASTQTLTNVPFSDGSSANTGSLPFAVPSLGTFLTSYGEFARVVSAGLAMRTTSGFNTNQGYLVAGSLPPQFFGTPVQNVTLSALQNAPGVVTQPLIAALDGIEVTYSPMDNRCIQFAKTGYTGTIPSSDARSFQVNPGTMFILAVGNSTATPPTFLFDLVVNYEVIVYNGNLLYGARPTYEDPVAMATARNARANDELVQVGAHMFDAKQLAANGLEALASDHNKIWSIHKLSVTPHSSSTPKLSPVLNTGFSSSSVVLHAAPHKLRGRGKMTAKELPEKPITESIIDGLVAVAKKVAPMLLSIL